MNYETLYKDFIKKVPESNIYCSLKANENFIDGTTGIHIIFGVVVVPYILEIFEMETNSVLQKIFDFLEEMAECDDVKVREVLDFTVLERLTDESAEVLDGFKMHMQQKTLAHCEAIEQYFNKC